MLVIHAKRASSTEHITRNLEEAPSKASKNHYLTYSLRQRYLVKIVYETMSLFRTSSAFFSGMLLNGRPSMIFRGMSIMLGRTTIFTTSSWILNKIKRLEKGDFLRVQWSQQNVVIHYWWYQLRKVFKKNEMAEKSSEQTYFKLVFQNCQKTYFVFTSWNTLLIIVDLKLLSSPEKEKYNQDCKKQRLDAMSLRL